MRVGVVGERWGLEDGRLMPLQTKICNGDDWQDDVQQHGAYAHTDPATKPSAWPRNIPGSESEMSKGSLSTLDLLAGPLEDIFLMVHAAAPDLNEA